MAMSPGRLALSLLASSALLVATTQPATAIVGGAPDDGEHPYVGQLLFYVPTPWTRASTSPAAGSTARAR